MISYLSVDSDDIDQAIEIALGDKLSADSFRPRSVESSLVQTWRRRLKRILGELPQDALVREILEAME